MNFSHFTGTAATSGINVSHAQMRTTLTTAQSVYGSQRPTFSDDGTGIPYSSSLNIARPSLTNQEISTHTNSKDPVMVRSRVFIGRIANAPITRDDLITLVKPFGNVLGLNHFKQGYAFVQFSTPSEADDAVAALNGKLWMGAIIDVHLVETEAAKKNEQRDRYLKSNLGCFHSNSFSEFLFGHGTSTENRNVHFEVKEDSPTDFYLSNIRKRNDENDHSDTRCSKLSRMDISPLEEIRLQNRFNRTIALGDYTTVDMISAEMADTLICGTCRYVTSDYESFKDHRIAGCNKRKDEEEPEYLKCISCGGRFRSAWALLHHLTEFHRMVLFKVEEEQKPQSVKDEGVMQSLSGAHLPTIFSNGVAQPKIVPSQSNVTAGQLLALPIVAESPQDSSKTGVLANCSN